MNNYKRSDPLILIMYTFKEMTLALELLVSDQKVKKLLWRSICIKSALAANSLVRRSTSLEGREDVRHILGGTESH